MTGPLENIASNPALYEDDEQPFSLPYRKAVSERVVSWAEDDPRISAAAVVGSLATGPGDRWSDLDLTFALADGATRSEVLQAWTEKLSSEYTADMLFDVSAGESLYRVFLLSGLLQLDLSFSPQSGFVQQGPQFRLVFGSPPQKFQALKPEAQTLFGYAAHHLLRARICVERCRFLQAEYWLHAGRDYALSLACLRHELPTAYGRGLESLPSEISRLVAPCLATSLDRNALIASLGATVDLVLQCSGPTLISDSLRTQLVGLSESWE